MNSLIARLALIMAVLGVLALMVWGTWAGTHSVAHRLAVSYYYQGVQKKAAGSQQNAYGQDYPQLYTWLIHARLRETEEADKGLTDYLTKRRLTKPDDWISTTGRYLLGQILETEFFAAAKSPDARKESGHLCEAWYFVGMKKWLNGEATAADCFQKCLATERKTFVEYRFAQAELKAPLRSAEPFNLRSPATKPRQVRGALAL